MRTRHTLVAFALVVGGCAGASERTTTSAGEPETTVSTATTTTESMTSTTQATTSTTVESSGEPPVINLAGYTTVYSQDGNVRVSGWLDRPAEVTVGDTPVGAVDDPNGMATFETVLDLEEGSHAITVTATDDQGLANEIVLSVLVDPTLEVQIAYVQDVDLVERTLVADYVELLTGDEAVVAAREDGVIGEGEELPGGFYLRNQDSRVKTLTLGDPEAVTLQACYLDAGPCVVEQAVDVDTWVELMSSPELAEELYGWSWYGGGALPYSITLQDGIVVQISEQYLP